MYTIGQISEMFGLPISTLRYYDKQGLFPKMKRVSGIRKFSDDEIEALRVIECLKKSGLEIKDIKQFMDLCVKGASTYPARKAIFEKQRENEQAICDGSEDRVQSMIPDKLPKDIKTAYENAHRD